MAVHGASKRPTGRPRVLVTRAAGQSSALADALEALGLEPVAIPAIRIEPCEDCGALDLALSELDRFDWLIFTSANAVEAFARRLAASSEPVRQLGMPRVAVIGEATGRAAKAAGMPVDLVPPSAVAESLAESLLPFAHGRDGVAARMLLVRAEEAREQLPVMLRAAGAEVTIVPVYRNVVPPDSIEPLRKLFRDVASGPGVEAVAFTSSSSVRNLLALCEEAGVSVPPRVLRVSIGPVTSQTLREAGVPPHAEAGQASVAALAQAVAKLLLA